MFDTGDDWPQILKNLGDIRLDRRELITCAVVASIEDILKLFGSRNRPKGIRLLREGKQIAVYEYERRSGKKLRRHVRGKFLVLRPDQEGVYVFVNAGSTAFWRYGLVPLIDHLYPRLALPFLTQTELHKVLRDLHSSVGPDRGIRVLEFCSKKRLPGASRKRFQSMREWTDADLDSVFIEARERNVWFKSVTFEFVRDRTGHTVSDGVRGLVSKYSHFSCSGDFETFASTVLAPIISVCASRVKFFSNRDRATTPGHAPRLVQISYDTDEVGSPAKTRKLVDVLSKYRHATCTVLHGNPYLHLSVVDNVDYSVADIWVVEQNQIVITPQLRASAAALKRIVNHIFENFREGRLSEYHESQGQVRSPEDIRGL